LQELRDVPRLARAWVQVSSYIVAITRDYLYRMQPNDKRVPANMENMREIIEFQVMTTFCRGGEYYVAAAPLLILRSWPPLQTGFDSFPSAWLG
jgi:hypothetical protein